MQVHATASWPAREDRRAALVWLGLFWIFVGVGFGFDLHNYLNEHPAVPAIVHVHAVATTLWLLTATAMVLLVETGNVKLHRRVGWFAAGYAALVIVIAPWSELSWQALNLQTPGSLPPQFLSIAFSGVVDMIVLLPWGVLMRRNPAAHRRVLILATIAISDAGFSRMVGLFLPRSNHVSWYLFVLRRGQSAADCFDVSVGLETRPGDEAVSSGGFTGPRSGPHGYRPLLQRHLEGDIPRVARGLGEAHAVVPQAEAVGAIEPGAPFIKVLS